MKNLLRISGILSILLLSLLLTGWADADDTVKEAQRHGNLQYEAADFEAALVSYETGLAAAPENKALNFNAAQAAYLQGEYEKAIDYYGKSGDATDKFLNAGNICFRAGDAVEDINQKVQFYGQALQIYKEGIVKYPQNVPLKYNYELVEEKLKELLENSEQENNEQGDSEENQEQKSENSESQQGEQQQESENSESQQGEQQQESEQEENSGEEQSQQQEGDDGQQNASSQNEGEEGQEATDLEAVERILQMLETQEEQSLKNNQEVAGGNEGKNGW